MSPDTKKLVLPVISLLINFQILPLLLLPAFADKKLSSEDEKKLNELIETSKPEIPVLGKINDPLKANVLFIEDKKEPEAKVITLLPLSKSKEVKSNKLAELEIKRNELQKAEEEGLNFIQPSLVLTEEEQKAIDEFFSRNEQEQLLNLWKSTIERNKTVQFITQKLAPLESPQAKNSLLSRTIGAAIFLPFYALQAFTNNAGAYYGSQVGGRVLGSIVEGKMQKNQAQLQLTQTEAVILFMMVDEIAERLRQRYHSYKRLMVERALATNELEESKKDSLDARDSKSPGAELIANIQRRSVEREIRRLDAQIRSQKNTLIELAGPIAVSDLDSQLKLELAATQNTPLDF